MLLSSNYCYLQETNTTFIFSNVVTYFTPGPVGNSDITRENYQKISVRCELERHRLLGVSYVPRIGVIAFTEEGFGNYSMSLERYPDETFDQPVIDNEAEVILGEPLFFGVHLWSIPGLVVFIENCWATPTPYPYASKTYSFLDNG